MNKRILLGVDTDFSPTTQYALRATSDFIERAAPQVRLILLNVIPVTQIVTTHPGMYVGQILPIEASSAQRSHAETVLRKARLLLQQQGIELERTEGIVRVGTPADEIVKVAKERRVSFIVVGSHGEGFGQSFRRFFTGSISHKVLQLSSCPVLVVALPRKVSAANLVAWYEEAIKNYLSEHPEALSVFTPERVALQFAPPGKNSPGRKETAAAEIALEHLTRSGRLCRHQVAGELRYVND